MDAAQIDLTVSFAFPGGGDETEIIDFQRFGECILMSLKGKEEELVQPVEAPTEESSFGINAETEITGFYS